MGGVDDLIDTVESWIARLDFWVQAPLLLAVFLPLAWLVAGLVDRLVERVTRRERPAAIPARRRG